MLGKSDTKALQEKLDLLQAENEQLRRKLMLLSGAGSTGSMTLGNLTSFGQTRVPAPQATIAGLSVAYLIVDNRWRVIRLNTRMGDFLNVHKDVVNAKPSLAELDNLEWAPHVFQTLLQDAGESHVEEIFEAERPNPVTGRSDYFQFKAVWSGEQGTVTVEDVTRLRTTRQFFERLVSPRIVERLLDSQEDPFVSQKRSMSVLFADLRSFTTFCENVEAPKVQAVFNEFFDVCMQALEANDATLDKFVGDQVMALFGAPLPNPGHAYNAVKVAVDLQQAMQRTRRRWIEEGMLPKALVDANPEILTLGVGINSGEMLLGMFGSQKANQYTVLGHHVNLAARLCSFASGNEVLASIGTVQEISKYAKENPARIAIPIKFRTKAQIEVKGIAEPVTVATLAYEMA
ncbi:MAG: adenylate/guanylate cyclase domain-containing protein [Planctomycetes bacterium]|nr:adenylate/guanylate cyclase domain-containing protein [Planctomycetota bacterium]MCB9936260.1 adenylate/guanylate cyclase domain-containing protein [Planctomycetota bacterium]